MSTCYAPGRHESMENVTHTPRCRKWVCIGLRPEWLFCARLVRLDTAFFMPVKRRPIVTPPREPIGSRNQRLPPRSAGVGVGRRFTRRRSRHTPARPRTCRGFPARAGKREFGEGGWWCAQSPRGRLTARIPCSAGKCRDIKRKAGASGRNSQRKPFILLVFSDTFPTAANREI